MIGTRMRQARLAAGLTLDEVVERLGRSLTKAAISKYELGKSAPGPEFLARLAGVLGVRASHFLDEPEIRVRWVAFRRHAALGSRMRERIRAFAERKVEDDLRLRSLLYAKERPAALPRCRATAPEEAEAAAARVRRAWRLSDLPIESLTAAVEDRGGVVVAWNGPDEFAGLCGWAGRRPVIVVNGSSTADRRRFSVAHELGHLALKEHSSSAKERESAANRFAAALLVPAEAARRELGARRRSLDLGELALLKTRYGLSMQAWIRRAFDLAIVGEAQYRKLNVLFRARGWHRTEPVPYSGAEEPRRFRLMARRALAEGLVSRSWVEAACPEALDGPSAPPETGYEPLRIARLGLEERRAELSRAAEAAAEGYRTDAEAEAWQVPDPEEAGPDEPW